MQVEVADKVDTQILETDEFAFIFEKSFRGAAENYQREKLDAFRGIIVNSAIGTNIQLDEKEYFLVWVSNLSTVHPES